MSKNLKKKPENKLKIPTIPLQDLVKNWQNFKPIVPLNFCVAQVKAKNKARGK